MAFLENILQTFYILLQGNIARICVAINVRLIVAGSNTWLQEKTVELADCDYSSGLPRITDCDM